MGKIPPDIQELLASEERFKLVKLEVLCARAVAFTRQNAFQILLLACGTRNKTLMDKVERFLWKQIAKSGPADGRIWLREFLDQFRQKRPMEFLEFVNRSNYDYTFHGKLPLAPARLTVQCLKANLRAENLDIAVDSVVDIVHVVMDLLNKCHASCNYSILPCFKCIRKEEDFKWFIQILARERA